MPGRGDPVDLPKHSPGNPMLQRLRDEAHRFEWPASDIEGAAAQLQGEQTKLERGPTTG